MAEAITDPQYDREPQAAPNIAAAGPSPDQSVAITLGHVVLNDDPADLSTIAGLAKLVQDGHGPLLDHALYRVSWGVYTARKELAGKKQELATTPQADPAQHAGLMADIEAFTQAIAADKQGVARRLQPTSEALKWVLRNDPMYVALKHLAERDVSASVQRERDRSLRLLGQLAHYAALPR